jgi:hypothetical protein
MTTLIIVAFIYAAYRLGKSDGPHAELAATQAKAHYWETAFHALVRYHGGDDGGINQ